MCILEERKNWPEDTFRDQLQAFSACKVKVMLFAESPCYLIGNIFLTYKILVLVHIISMVH